MDTKFWLDREFFFFFFENSFLTWKNMLQSYWWLISFYSSVVFEICIKSIYYFHIQGKKNFKNLEHTQGSVYN